MRAVASKSLLARVDLSLVPICRKVMREKGEEGRRRGRRGGTLAEDLREGERFSCLVMSPIGVSADCTNLPKHG